MKLDGRWGIRPLIAAGAVVAGLTAGACGGEPATTNPEYAREFTERALAAVGLEGVQVAESVRAARCGRPAQPGWRASAAVAGGEVELCVARAGGEALSVLDTADDGSALLSDDQVARLDRFRYEPGAEGEADLLPLAAVAAVLVVAVGAAAVRTVPELRAAVPQRLIPRKEAA